LLIVYLLSCALAGASILQSAGGGLITSPDFFQLRCEFAPPTVKMAPKASARRPTEGKQFFRAIG